MASDATVEWGDERRVRLIDRLFGDPATSPVRQVSVPALACGVIAVALFAVAEALPWLAVQRAFESGDLPTTVLTDHETSIEGVADGAVTAYYFGIVLLLMVVGAALVGRPYVRRVLSAAGFGLSAGMLIVIIGLIAKAGRGGDLGTVYAADASAETGPYVAIAAVLAAAGALALSGWHPHRSTRRRPADVAEEDEDVEVEPGPIDLTVSSG
jgi:hypothetical protein